MTEIAPDDGGGDYDALVCLNELHRMRKDVDYMGPSVDHHRRHPGHFVSHLLRNRKVGN